MSRTPATPLNGSQGRALTRVTRAPAQTILVPITMTVARATAQFIAEETFK